MLSGHVRPTSSCRSLNLSTRIKPSSRSVVSKRSSITASGSRSFNLLSTSPAHTKAVDLSSRRLSDLGLRSQRPPDSIPDPDEPPLSELLDEEWEIRTGRAIYVIQETLPEFFEHGLISSVNKATGLPSRPTSKFPSPTHLNFLDNHTLQGGSEEPIYSPNIKMSYTPPAQLPPPFPKTFHVEGQQLYLASAGIIRHTMNALYSDLTLKTTKLVIKSPPSISSTSENGKRRINREKSFLVRQVVSGIARVSGKPSEWEIESTYTFSPLTGLIHQHIVDSIQPAPHVAVYDSLRLTLGKLLGWEPSSSGAATTTTPNGAACKGDLRLPDGRS